MRREREPQPEQIPPYMETIRRYDQLIKQFKYAPEQKVLDQIQDQFINLSKEYLKPGRFELGRVLASQKANYAMSEWAHSPLEFLLRHKNGDWGSVNDEVWKANDRAIAESTRIFSAYPTRNDKTLWVITEWDRSVTSITLPGEY